MARKKREWYPGATYHLMSRGNRHQKIFEDPTDYEFFLTLLGDIQRRFSFDLHSYCLMTNHFHMLLETKECKIWHIMKRPSQIYAEYDYVCCSEWNQKDYRSVREYQGSESCKGVEVFGFRELSEVIRFLEGKAVPGQETETEEIHELKDVILDFADVKGQDELIDAVVLAVAGGHNMLMIGEPGCGKTMIAQRIPMENSR